MYYCDVERDCPQADGDEPAGDWATSHDSVHDVLVNKKSSAMLVFVPLFQAEDGIRDVVSSRGLGDVYKRQLGLCEMRWKNFGETTTEEGYKVFFSGTMADHVKYAKSNRLSSNLN